MNYYAIVNDESICTGFATTTGEILDRNYIKVQDTAVPIGKKYQDGLWVEVEKIPKEPEPTQMDRIEMAVLKKNDDIAAAAIDEYTLQLMEGGIL